MKPTSSTYSSGRRREITIDAIPNKTFKGHVTEIGDTAILRSTGVAASQSAISSQEAKDFKVVVAMDNPPEEDPARSFLHGQDHHRDPPERFDDSDPGAHGSPERRPGTAQTGANDGAMAATIDPATAKANKEEIQGVFVVNAGKAEFRKVDTGITGATDIEVLSGLKDGDQIVTGSYQVIRTIKNHAQVKVDNTPPPTPTAS